MRLQSLFECGNQFVFRRSVFSQSHYIDDPRRAQGETIVAVVELSRMHDETSDQTSMSVVLLFFSDVHVPGNAPREMNGSPGAVPESIIPTTGYSMLATGAGKSSAVMLRMVTAVERTGP